MHNDPPSSPGPILQNTTNFNAWRRDPDSPRRGSKRQHPLTEKTSLKPPSVKRLKLTKPSAPAEEQASDNDEPDSRIIIRRGKRRTTFGCLNAIACTPPNKTAPLQLPSRSILQSFVSSHKSDVFKCFSNTEGRMMTTPYACAFSNCAKEGRDALLATATEEGTIIILNTAKRRDWDYEPQRTVLTPHSNGIFDVKWSADDTRIATASGDKSIRITSVERQTVLHTLSGHSSTVKCVAWDPTHRDILCSGSRDGSIRIWDLRVSGQLMEDNSVTLESVITHLAAHGKEKITGRRKTQPHPRTVTSVVYSGNAPHGLVSSGSHDGILHYWDMRLPSDSPKKTKKLPTSPIRSSSVDPTVLQGSCRPRGIKSVTAGSGPSAGLLFALGSDSRLHTYDTSSLVPLAADTHPNLRVDTFYVRTSISPCGRWLASGSSGSHGSVFLFDVSNAGRLSAATGLAGGSRQPVELRGQSGEIGALDWADDMLATCADDCTVRLWRPDLDIHHQCLEDPEEKKWEWCWTPPL